jgi:hypothetical protein
VKTPVPALKVNFNTELDMECALLGEAGWHTKAIARATHLTPSQVLYRLKRAGVRRVDYRNGVSEIAKYVKNQLKHQATDRQLQLAEQLGPQIRKLNKRYVKQSLKKIV